MVMRMSGGWRAIWRRSSDGVSPVREATEIRGGCSPSRCAASPMPVSGDVQDPDLGELAFCWRRAGCASQAVQAPQERSEGLAAASRRVDQGVVPRRDRRPTLRLSLRGRLEAGAEPVADGGREPLKRIAGRARLDTAVAVGLGEARTRRWASSGRSSHGTWSIGRTDVLDHLFYSARIASTLVLSAPDQRPNGIDRRCQKRRIG